MKNKKEKFPLPIGEIAIGKDEIASLLKVDPSALEAFEDAYRKSALEFDKKDDNFFSINSRIAKKLSKKKKDADVNNQQAVDDLVHRIVKELLADTKVYKYDGELQLFQKLLPPGMEQEVSNEEICRLPESLRPQLSGNLMKVDINGNSAGAVLAMYEGFLKTGDKDYYNNFRQGLDILDLDPLTYAIIDCNKVSMGYWLPKLVDAVTGSSFFKIPKTTVVKIPMPLLQLTRLDYRELTETTRRIVNEYAMKAFDLDVNKAYFIKTGTFSSKFDFRNCKVYTEQEVRELGEYLLFIHFQALQMAMPLSQPVIYGASTTVEWVVREYIEDTENNPTIYKGLPLHTEYRVFVDCDTDEVIGVSPYWEPETMKRRFSTGNDKNSPHQIHDYIIYKSHEDVLMERYNQNVDKVVSEVGKLLTKLNLEGQWSIDVMQNGDDFWIIDMATACSSALVECVPKEKLKKFEENWIPKIDTWGSENGK